MMVAILLGLTVFLAVAGLYFAFTDGRRIRRRDAIARLERVLSGQPEIDLTELGDSILRETESDLSSVLSGAAQRYAWLRNLDLLLYRAGRPLTLQTFFTLTLTATLAGFGATMALLSLPYGAIAGALPWLVVRYQKRARMTEFDNQFPQALQLLSRALRAGHGLGSGLQMVGESLADPVGSEFGLVAREISLGLDPPTAMANLQDRMDSQDLPIFVTAVLVQMETGGNLAEVLDNIAGVVRERLLFYGKVNALTAESRITANLLACLPFGMGGMVYLTNPDQLSPLWLDPMGKSMAITATVMVALGYLLCRRIASVEP